MLVPLPDLHLLLMVTHIFIVITDHLREWHLQRALVLSEWYKVRSMHRASS